MKKTIIIVCLIIVIATSVRVFLFYQINLYDKSMRNRGVVGLVKNSKTIYINKDDDRSYTILDYKFDFWNKEEREKAKEYMKKNNLIIKQGKYYIADNSTFERAMEEFQFEKNTEN